MAIAADGLRNLVTVFAELYPDEGSIKRFCRQSGIDYARLNKGSALNTWSELLNEAVMQDKLPVIMTMASAEYPTHAPLIAAAHEVRVMMPSAGLAAVEVKALRDVVESHGIKILEMWGILHPTPRQRIANVLAVAIAVAWVVMLIIPATSVWLWANPGWAAGITVGMAALAALIRILPNGTH